jgi:hypothetical protein
MWILHVGARHAVYLPKSAFCGADRERLTAFLAAVPAAARAGAAAG